MAVITIVSYPIAVCTYFFRLYAHPKNPDAWFVLSLQEAVHLLVACFILRGSNLARWFCALWVTANVGIGIFGLGRFSDFPSLQAFILTCWAIQLVVVTLLFVPPAGPHFRKKVKKTSGLTLELHAGE